MMPHAAIEIGSPVMPHAAVEIILWLFGLCIGSFLNVVVYRLPAGLSISRPPRSFCPRCRAGIAWYDNLPLASWLLLRGRCRHCAAPIAVQYPLIEALTGLAFVLVYHLLFVLGSRDGVSAAALPADLPLLLVWLVLAAGLVACAAMDILSYSVDVRVTLVVMIAGVVLHALWPARGFLVAPAASVTAAAALGAFVVSGLLLWHAAGRAAEHEPEPELAPDPAHPGPGAAPQPAARAAGICGVAVFVALAVGLVLASTGRRPALPDLAVLATLAAIFAVIVLAGGQPRAADQEIMAAIEDERPQARHMALRELKWLLPIVLAATAVLVAAWARPGFAAGWDRAVRWNPAGRFVPLAGAAYAIHGAVVGAAAGWLLRIVFTLVFGREAFGVGDIHILAAAGAAAGWDIALLGLLLSVGIALIGWLLGLLLKSTVMIPFGPWLALGFLLALWWNVPATAIARSYADDIGHAWRIRPDLILLAVGVLLVGAAAGVALARLVRRWTEPK
jgi:leader peptidase (prepilin peptidase)/N-methyltransferase